MVYEWDDKFNDAYRLYVEERMNLDQVMEWFKREKGFAPSKRAFQTQFKKWDFPSKQHPLQQDEDLTTRVRELWENNVSQKDMLRMLNEEGFSIKERELMRLRGRNRWLLRTPNGQAPANDAANGTVPVQEDNDVLSSAKSTANGKGTDKQAPQVQPETDDTLIERQQQLLQKRQAESDERWTSRKRRRRTRGWAGLPADPEGPPRFPSETTIDESKVILKMDNDLYRQIRDEFQAICEEEGVIKKTLAGPEKWQVVKDRLIQENEHLQDVIYNDNVDTTDQKLLSLDVICLDVTKRMRVMQTRVTIADAKNTLCINPEESRQIRAAFYSKLKSDNFTNKTDLGNKRWNEIKQEWIAESELLQRILDPEDPDHQSKVKALEMLCRDVMKRLRDDQARRDPNRQKQLTGPGPGPAPPRPFKTTTNGAITAPPPAPVERPHRPPPPETNQASVAETEQLAAELLTHASATDLQIDPSLLLAANGALPQAEQNHYSDYAPAPMAVASAAPMYSTQPAQAASMGVFMEPKIWLGTLSSGTVGELRQLAASHHPGSQVLRIDGIVKDGNTGTEVSYLIDDDAKLGGYLAHVTGGDAMFEVRLIGGSGNMNVRAGF
ncbi:hypothetical protein NA57DRAFT_64927 [Rhizodiscina lignyota]|uniref:Clr5 domain-containing protein n=1 Tax=Rhizodiscina lignyota TaxID=1504668 RepID=A0A9P4IEF5_9PEZI|nr:hypothetical protein NA57DRAFT_64927 [Rhizodiscina lignyota]